MISEIAGTCRILVIDDDPVTVEMVRRVLTRAGFSSIDSTSEPSIAVALLRETKPHVVLLDLNMPKMDGFAVLDLLNEEAKRVGCSIIMLTGETQRDVQVQALRRGASDFVTKPFEVQVLAARIANAAEMRELQRRQRDQNERLQEAVAVRTQRLQEALDVLSRAETELKRSLAQVEAQNHSRSEILAELAHELRTPLNAIGGFSDLMRRQEFGPLAPRYLDYCEDIHGATLHMLEVINGFLDLSKAASGEEPLVLSMVDVGTLVADSMKLLAQQAKAAGVDLKLVVKPGLEEVETDRTKLSQIILNMTSNAVKFTPRGGAVAVEVGPSPDGGAYIIVVRDTGIGIAAKDLPDVMRPFGQVRSAQAGRPKGTGLGMPLTRQYVEMLGGTLSVASRPGHGTEVTIRLPKFAPPKPAHSPVYAEASA
ncbi:MAG TPA: hybrid sensor histidine kinase/response regulator [Stellaceae bacterium]|nr:hybrid sensor histidine kinase/response regulator [Stellaceae bacterium]